MTGIYIHCPLLPPADYRKVLCTLCPDTVRNVTVHIHADHVTPEGLKALMNEQEAFGLLRPIRFRNILVLQTVPRVTRALRKVLSKHSISLHLQVTPGLLGNLKKPVAELTRHGISCKLWADGENQAEVYQAFRQAGLPLNLHRPRYDAQTADWFSRWLYEADAVGLNTFCDIISMLTLEVASPNCRYASCFGTTFRVDEQLQVYLCPRHMDSRTHLGALAAPDKLLQCDAVASLLTEAIAKRSQCLSSCQGFAHCQGGCLLETATDTECACYTATVERIRTALLEVYRSGRLSQVNPVVKNAILNALAFGSAFFNPPANQKA